MKIKQAGLTAKTVSSLAKAGRYGDAGGLYLVVDKAGSKRWVFIYQVRGRRREMGLGSADSISLAEARAARDRARVQLARGRDPIDVRREEAAKVAPKTVPTFGEVAKEVIANLPLSSEKYRRQWSHRLTTLAASLQEKAVDKIGVSDVLAVLKPHWHRVPITAQRARGQIERILDAARAAGHITGPWENPARWRGHIELLLPVPQREVKHHASLPYEDIGQFLANLRSRKGTAPRALEFAILTAARTSEVRFLTWAEIDMDARVWICPRRRMKQKKKLKGDHRVPLSDAAMAVLKEAQFASGSDPDSYVFCDPYDGRPQSDGAMERVLDRMKVAATVHGFRSTFRDWAGDCTDYAENVIEVALSHVVGDETQRAYRRRDALEKRRELMADWAAFCNTPAGANVSPLKRTA